MIIHQIQSPGPGCKAQYLGRNAKTGQMVFFEGSDITNAKPRLILPESELYFSLPEIWQIYCRKAWERINQAI